MRRRSPCVFESTAVCSFDVSHSLRCLLIEASDTDAELVVGELRRADFDPSWRRCESEAALAAALESGSWDVIVSEWALPELRAMGALALVKERGLDLPVIVVAAEPGENDAVEAMRAGASDYISKAQLTRLGPVIERALRETEGRREHKRLQAQLLLADRMVSVGTLAAGVAHEINNPLAALIANLEFLSADLPKTIDDARLRTSSPECAALVGWLEGRVRELVDPLAHAREAADRVRHIVRDLRVFSRRDEEQSVRVDLRRVVESAIRLAWHEIRYRARVVNTCLRVPAVEGNEARLGQVFLNLIINAAQAIPGGAPAVHQIRISSRVTADDRVVIEVADTGVGIAPENLARIFDPFFTTKPPGVGTGLGLWICHSIVTGLGGDIAVESDVGRGTTFRVTLPAARRSTTSGAPADSSPGSHRARILVVDDDPLLGNVFRRLLGADHDIFIVSGAQAALDLLSSGRRFDAIFCDVMMPLTPGAALHAHIGDIDQEQAERVVFMTGGVFTAETRAFLDRVPNPRIEKPFDVATLRRVVEGMAKSA